MNSNDLLTLAQRMREYNHNPHHINPVSESFHTLIKDSADALSAVAKELTALKAQQAQQELDELRRACAEILGQDPEAWPSHGNAPLAIASALALAVSTAPQPAPAQPAVHPDDAAVDRFAAAMKAKLAKAREKGRGGWDDPAQCYVEFLAKLLVEHLTKGNAGTFEDVANFAMMLHQRGADPQVLAELTNVRCNCAREYPHDDYAALETECNALRVENDRLRAAEKDAARYRWLRAGRDHKTSTATHIASSYYGLEWDAAIDTAMKGE